MVDSKENYKFDLGVKGLRVTVTITFEPPISAIPTESFLFMPPDSARACVCLLSDRPMHSIILSTSFFTCQDERVFSLAKNHRCSSTVSRSNNTSCWGQRPEEKLSYRVLLTKISITLPLTMHWLRNLMPTFQPLTKTNTFYD